MKSCVQFNSQENYFLINNIIKINNESIEKIFNKRNLEDLIKLDDNLYYYKGKPLIELLFEIEDYKQIKFKNNDYNDYRLNNIEVIYNEKKNEHKFFKDLFLYNICIFHNFIYFISK
jgi:hypothetical protein